MKAERDSVEETTLDSSIAEAPQEKMEEMAEGDLELNPFRCLLQKNGNIHFNKLLQEVGRDGCVFENSFQAASILMDHCSLFSRC